MAEVRFFYIKPLVNSTVQQSSNAKAPSSNSPYPDLPNRAFGHESCSLTAYQMKCLYVWSCFNLLFFVVSDLFSTEEISYRAQVVALWSGELEESLHGAMNARANRLIELISDWNIEIAKLESFIEELTIAESLVSR